MSEKYFCLICGHRFDEADRSENTGGYYCPECGHDKLLHESLKSKPFLASLLDWLNPWHPASEPPENIIEKKLLLMEINSTTKRRYWRIGRWLSRNESLGICIGWRELPPMLGKESR